MPQNFTIELVFKHNYQVRDLRNFPEYSGPIRTFGAPEEGGIANSDWISIMVTPSDALEWLGRFAPAYGVPPAINGVFSTPNPNQVCVVAGGQGYVIDVRNPTTFERVRCFPITAVAQSPAASRLVFADFTDLEGWDANRKVWDTGRVSVDDLKIVKTNANTLLCQAWDGVELFEFEIELRDGIIIGGHRDLPFQ